MKRKFSTLLVTLIASLGISGVVSAAVAQDFNNFPTRTQGSTGGYVKALQANLWSSGYQSTVGTVDGSFGPGTTSAVKSFQSSQGLTADGSVGPATWKKMSGYIVNESLNLFYYSHPGSTTYMTTYYATDTTMEYSLRYRSNGSVVSSGRVY